MQDSNDAAGKFQRSPEPWPSSEIVISFFCSRRLRHSSRLSLPLRQYQSDSTSRKERRLLEAHRVRGLKKKIFLSSRVTQAAALFQITSDKFDSRVERRYSDFDKLYGLFLLKYSNRMIPRTPPKQILSELYKEERREGLRRWLRLISHHQALSNDEMFRRFMTDKTQDIQSLLQDLYDAAPNELTKQSVDLMPPVDRGALWIQRERIRTMQNLVAKLKILIRNQNKREADQSREFADMAHVLTSMDQKGLDDIAKNLTEIAAESEKVVKNQQETVMERLDIIIEALQGHLEMCDRIEKKITSEPTFSQPTSMRSRFSSVVRTPSTDAVFQLEAEHSRQNIFAMFCLGQETRHAETYLQLIPSILLQFSNEESNCFTNIAKTFNKIIQNESDKLSKG